MTSKIALHAKIASKLSLLGSLVWQDFILKSEEERTVISRLPGLNNNLHILPIKLPIIHISCVSMPILYNFQQVHHLIFFPDFFEVSEKLGFSDYLQFFSTEKHAFKAVSVILSLSFLHQSYFRLRSYKIYSSGDCRNNKMKRKAWNSYRTMYSSRN